jgi:hypothetical protein
MTHEDSIKAIKGVSEEAGEYKESTLSKLRKGFRNFFDPSMPRMLKEGTADEYFALPKDEREQRGFYLSPRGFVFSPCFRSKGSICSERDKWEKEIMRLYPFQWFFREYLLSLDNPVYYFFWRIKMLWEDKLFYPAKHYLIPQQKNFRETARRLQFQYADIRTIISSVNFALLLDFKEEADNSLVDFEASGLTDFKKKLDEYSAILRDEFKSFKNEEDEAWKQYEKNESRPDLEKLWEIEKRESDLKKEILTWMMENRERFWT